MNTRMDKRLFPLRAATLLLPLFVICTAWSQTPETAASPTAPQPTVETDVPQRAPAANDAMARKTSDFEPMSADSLERLDLVDTDLASLRRSTEEGDVVLEVAGFGITLSGSSSEWLRPADPEKPRSRVSPTLLAATEYGYNVPTGFDYGAYPAGSDRFLGLRNGKSFHLSSTLIGLSVDLGRSRLFRFSTGLRYTVDNFRLSDSSITLGNEDGMIVPIALDEQADKSKLRITSLGLPLTFSCHAARNLSVALTGYFDFTMGANAIYKRPKVKNSLDGVNSFRFGVGAAIAYHSVGVYVRYSVTPLFELNVGPTLRPLSIGLCLDL